MGYLLIRELGKDLVVNRGELPFFAWQNNERQREAVERKREEGEIKKERACGVYQVGRWGGVELLSSASTFLDDSFIVEEKANFINKKPL